MQFVYLIVSVQAMYFLFKLFYEIHIYGSLLIRRSTSSSSQSLWIFATSSRKRNLL